MPGERPDGFVLAGGRSQRMGVDKARVPFPGRGPMALEVAAILGRVCGRVALVRRPVTDPLPWPEGTEVLHDRAPEDDAHPLWGVAAALEASRTDRALIAPCDQPWLVPAALEALLAADRGDGAVAWDGQRVHPLIAVLPADRAGEAADAARAGSSVRSFVAGCVRVPLEPHVLRDLDRWEMAGKKGPIRSLLDGLGWLTPEARERIAEGERRRLAARGVVDPEVG